MYVYGCLAKREKFSIIKEIGMEKLNMTGKEEALLKVKNKVENCMACELGKTCTNKVFSDGNPNAKIVLIGEAPGAEEDASGVPFVGRAGKFLTQMITDAGFDRQKDFYIINTVKCRPPENRVPTDFEKDCCKEFLFEQLKLVQPKVIVLCGATALKSFVKKVEPISKIRGQWMEIFGGTKAMAIFHPSYLLRKHSTDEGSPRDLTKKDLLNIKNFVSEK